jgi:hypothetical protein
MDVLETAAFIRKTLTRFAKDHGSSDNSYVVDRLRDRASVIEKDGQPQVVITDLETGVQRPARELVTEMMVAEPHRFRGHGLKPSEPANDGKNGLTHAERMKNYLATRATNPTELGLNATKLNRRLGR